MRKKPTPETMTFYCPRCGYKQKGYFNLCPTPECNDAGLREFVAAGMRAEQERKATKVTATTSARMPSESLEPSDGVKEIGHGTPKNQS